MKFMYLMCLLPLLSLGATQTRHQKKVEAFRKKVATKKILKFFRAKRIICPICRSGFLPKKAHLMCSVSGNKHGICRRCCSSMPAKWLSKCPECRGLMVGKFDDTNASLNLSGLGLRDLDGEFAKQFGETKSLDISGNIFEQGELGGLGEFENLEKLNLSNNGLHKLPESFFYLDLDHLVLDNNPLEFEAIKSLVGMDTLKSVSLRGVSFPFGVFPKELLGLEDLSTIYLRDNGAVGRMAGPVLKAYMDTHGFEEVEPGKWIRDLSIIPGSIKMNVAMRKKCLICRVSTAHVLLYFPREVAMKYCQHYLQVGRQV